MSRYHVAAWPILVILAILNGWLREAGYGRWLPELAAHQVSTLLLALITGLVACRLARRWPLAGPWEAWRIGAIWSSLTTVFEFGFGHFVIGHSWQRLLQDYEPSGGRVWGLYLAYLLTLPYLCWRIRQRHAVGEDNQT